MKIVFYGNRQVGMVGLLTTMALGYEIIEVWADNRFGIPGIDQLLLPRKIIYSENDLATPGEKADLLLCVHGRKIVPESVLKGFRLGGINIHPFLDKYPGANPVERAILAEETIATVYAHRMSPEVDKGEIIACATTKIPTRSERPTIEPVHIYNELYPLYAQVIAIALKKLDASTSEK
ncbi:MAG: formyltransferase family protein [Anaerolineae bacterium]|jgi:methionyl-tRNA formyltransferase|nr:formyltransferase family protein [Anaerolineae bacterium]